MKVQINTDTVKLSLSEEDTIEWGKGWPYSQFAGSNLEIMVNDVGVYGIFINGEERYANINFRELHSLLKDHICLLYTSPSPRDS